MPTLLTLDDSRELLLLRSALFGAAGFHVIACDDPVVALKTLAHQKVALVITDYDMPGMDGVRFSEYARRRGFHGPIILSTGTLHIPEQAGLWIDRILDKATPPAALLHTVDSFLSHDRTLVEPACPPAAGLRDEALLPCAA